MNTHTQLNNSSLHSSGKIQISFNSISARIHRLFPSQRPRIVFLCESEMSLQNHHGASKQEAACQPVTESFLWLHREWSDSTQKKDRKDAWYSGTVRPDVSACRCHYILIQYLFIFRFGEFNKWETLRPWSPFKFIQIDFSTVAMEKNTRLFRREQPDEHNAVFRHKHSWNSSQIAAIIVADESGESELKQ